MQGDPGSNMTALESETEWKERRRKQKLQLEEKLRKQYELNVAMGRYGPGAHNGPSQGRLPMSVSEEFEGGTEEAEEEDGNDVTGKGSRSGLGLGVGNRVIKNVTELERREEEIEEQRARIARSQYLNLKRRDVHPYWR